VSAVASLRRAASSSSLFPPASSFPASSILLFAEQ
jgi:hypothetical protein